MNEYANLHIERNRGLRPLPSLGLRRAGGYVFIWNMAGLKQRNPTLANIKADYRICRRATAERRRWPIIKCCWPGCDDPAVVLDGHFPYDNRFTRCAAHRGKEPRILVLSVMRRWFDLIASGAKRIEYRRRTPYWNARLFDRDYDFVEFVNGYGHERPFAFLECLSITQRTDVPGDVRDALGIGRTTCDFVFAIALGRLLHTGHLNTAPSDPGDLP